MWDAPFNAQSSWAGWHLAKSTSYKPPLLELMLWKSFSIRSFLIQPLSTDFTMRRSNLWQNIFPVDVYMYWLIFRNTCNSKLYLFRHIHLRLSQYIKDTQPQYLSCVQEQILFRNYHRFPPLPPKIMFISAREKARKNRYAFHLDEYTLNCI